MACGLGVAPPVQAADYWAPTAEYLQAYGYGVPVPDQAGLGKSSKPVDYRWSLAAMALQRRDL